MTSGAQSLLAELNREAASTRRLLERVPEDRLAWRPHAKSMTLGQLAGHVAAIPGNITRLAGRDGFDAAEANFEPAQPTSAADLVATLENGLAEARTFLNGLDDESSRSGWRLTFGEREIFTVPRSDVLRTLLLNHWYHHRGQLAVYLRILDVPVPAVYGRSADEATFAPLAAV